MTIAISSHFSSVSAQSPPPLALVSSPMRSLFLRFFYSLTTYIKWLIKRCVKLVDQTLRAEAGYEEYEFDSSNKDFAIVALDLLSGLGNNSVI